MKHLHATPVLVLGLGASGLAMARWCARHGAQVTVADTRDEPPRLAQLQAEWPGVAFIGGAFSSALIEGSAIRAVYRSPGLSPADIAPVVDAARAAGLPVGGELDLFALALHDLRTVEVLPGLDADEPAQAEPVLDVPADAQPDLPSDPGAGASAEGHATGAEAVPDPTPAADAPQVKDGGAARASTVVTVPTPGQAYVPTAAKEAAAFVARIAELSAASDAADAQAAAQEAAKAERIDTPVIEAPKGYAPALIAVTGTNGKTTVTALTGQLIERAGKRVAVAGNIGPTLLDTLAAHLDAGTLPDAWVLELSSFQLDGVQGFEPTAATVLNISQDHLDWHGSSIAVSPDDASAPPEGGPARAAANVDAAMAAYVGAKARIFGATGLMVLNRDDPAVMAMLPPPVKVRLQRPQVRTHVTFGAGLPQRPGDFGIERVNGMAWLVRAHEADETLKRKRGALVEAEEIQLQRLMPADALRIRGQHNALNALAALALANAAGCPLGPMLYGLREYRGEPHRVEPVALIDEVEYFDDSKGTNVGATVAALTGLGVERRVVAILGGEGKGQDFAPLAEPVARYARAVILIGRDAPLLEAALQGSGVTLLHAATLPEAVNAAAGRARSGDAVLLSPACASFDMFRDYAHRAEVFCEAVHALAAQPHAYEEGQRSQ